MPALSLAAKAAPPLLRVRELLLEAEVVQPKPGQTLLAARVRRPYANTLSTILVDPARLPPEVLESLKPITPRSPLRQLLTSWLRSPTSRDCGVLR